MGWNTGYTIFESTVVGAYDLGLLDKGLLAVLMEPYRGSDIDSGGSQDLLADDGLDVEEIVLKVWGEEVPTKPDPETSDDETLDRYYEAKYEAFREVTKHFGWW